MQFVEYESPRGVRAAMDKKISGKEIAGDRRFDDWWRKTFQYAGAEEAFQKLVDRGTSSTYLKEQIMALASFHNLPNWPEAQHPAGFSRREIAGLKKRALEIAEDIETLHSSRGNYFGLVIALFEWDVLGHFFLKDQGKPDHEIHRWPDACCLLAKTLRGYAEYLQECLRGWPMATKTQGRFLFNRGLREFSDHLKKTTGFHSDEEIALLLTAFFHAVNYERSFTGESFKKLRLRTRVAASSTNARKRKPRAGH
jgi:hypothetical protein